MPICFLLKKFGNKKIFYFIFELKTIGIKKGWAKKNLNFFKSGHFSYCASVNVFESTWVYLSVLGRST